MKNELQKKGKYKVKLSFDAKQMLKNPDTLPRQPSDYLYRPLLLFIEQDWELIKKEKKRKKKGKKNG